MDEGAGNSLNKHFLSHMLIVSNLVVMAILGSTVCRLDQMDCIRPSPFPTAQKPVKHEAGVWWRYYSTVDSLSQDHLRLDCFSVPSDSFSQQHLWFMGEKRGVERTNAPAFGWQTSSLETTVAVPLEGEIGVFWHYLRTHQTPVSKNHP